MKNSQTRVCPEWGKSLQFYDLGLIGVLDSSDCNHMICEKCEAEWCYFCGKEDDDLKWDQNSFYSHFEKWQKDKEKCPMYLFDINRYTREWPKP